MRIPHFYCRHCTTATVNEPKVPLFAVKTTSCCNSMSTFVNIVNVVLTQKPETIATLKIFTFKNKEDINNSV